MCNLCRYLNTIDVNRLSSINPWSDEETSSEDYTDMANSNPWSSDEEGSSKICAAHLQHSTPSRETRRQRAPPTSEDPLKRLSVESFIFDNMVSMLNSEGTSPPSDRHLPDDYPTFHISTVSSSDNLGSMPYELNRAPSSTMSVNTKFSTTTKLKKRGHRRSNQVLSASSPTGRSPRDSLDGLFTPSPLSSFNQRDAEEDYFSYKK